MTKRGWGEGGRGWVGREWDRQRGAGGARSWRWWMWEPDAGRHSIGAMRRVLALVCLAAIAATSCGVLADDTAGSVAGNPVSTETVSALVADDTLVGALQGLDPGSEVPEQGESVQEGDITRQALAFALQTAAIEQLADSLDLELDLSDTSQLEEELAGGGIDPGQLSEPTKNQLNLQMHAQGAIQDWYGDLDLQSAEAATELYDLAPQIWQRRCVDVLAVQESSLEVVQEKVEAGRILGVIDEQVDGAEMVLTSDNCVSVARILAELSGSVTDALVDAAVGEVVGPLEVESPDGAGGTSVVTVWFEVVGDEPGSPESMAEELSGQPWFDPSVIVVWNLLTDTQVNPRYGLELEMIGRSFVIGRPEAPEPVEPVIEVDLGTESP